MRTHLTIGFFASLCIIPYVSHNLSFIPIVLLASLLPDIDCMHSYLGKHWIFRPLQWLIKHRGMLHSLTFCFLVTFFFALFLPVVSLPFFIGYGLHLFADSMTIEGIRPWWPWKDEAKGTLRTGGLIEQIIFICLAALSVLLIVRLFI